MGARHLLDISATPEGQRRPEADRTVIYNVTTVETYSLLSPTRAPVRKGRRRESTTVPGHPVRQLGAGPAPLPRPTPLGTSREDAKSQSPSRSGPRPGACAKWPPPAAARRPE